MVVEKGYKETNIGLIPEDWEIKTVSKIGSIQGRVGWKGYTVKDLRDSGAYTIGAKHIDKQNRLDLSDPTFLSQEKYLESPEIMVNKNDILIVQRGTIGKVVLIKEEIGEATINPSMLILRLQNSISNYIFYYFISSQGQKQILNDTSSTGVPMITQKQVLAFSVPLPPLPEQTAIANALSDMDALIAQTEKLIEKKKAIKQGVMQELLKPKEGWVTKKLGEIGEISGAGVDKKIVDGEVPVRLVNYMDVYKRDFIYSNELSHWVTAPNQKLLSCQVRKGDVFFTPSSETREDIALPAVAMEDIDDAVYSYHLVRFRAFDYWDLRFKAYIFNTIQFLQQAEKQCEGSGKRYVLTLPKFRSLLISYPSSVEEQEKISDIIWDIDIEIQITETKLQKLKNQKQGMMQALLTGKIRLI